MTLRTVTAALALTALIITALVSVFLVSERVHTDASARCEAAYLASGSITVGCLTYLDDAEEAGRIQGVTEALLD